MEFSLKKTCWYQVLHVHNRSVSRWSTVDRWWPNKSQPPNDFFRGNQLTVLELLNKWSPPSKGNNWMHRIHWKETTQFCIQKNSPNHQGGRMGKQKLLHNFRFSSHNLKYTYIHQCVVNIHLLVIFVDTKLLLKIFSSCGLRSRP